MRSVESRARTWRGKSVAKSDSVEHLAEWHKKKKEVVYSFCFPSFRWMPGAPEEDALLRISV